MANDHDPKIQMSAQPELTPNNSSPSRRSFLRNGSIATMAAAIGMQIPFKNLLPEGVQLVGLAHAADMKKIDGKIPEMIILNDKPLNAEPPPPLSR